MWRIAILTVPILMSGCDAGGAPSATEAAGPIDWASVRAADVPPGRTAVLVLGDDGTQSARFERLDAIGLAGDYYCGDGTGYNLQLTVDESGRYQCTWRGCLGLYGSCSGRWSAAATTLILKTESADGMFKEKPLGPLFVVALGEHYQLVQERDRKFFDEWGPSQYVCLHREKDTPALHEAEKRKMELRIQQGQRKTAGSRAGPN